MSKRARDLEALFNQIVPAFPNETLVHRGRQLVVEDDLRNALFRVLREKGFRVKRAKAPHSYPKGSWCASLKQDVLREAHFCDHCGEEVESAGVKTHGRTCEHCGNILCLEVTDGGWIQFSFTNEGSEAKRITMRTKRFFIDSDKQAGLLILYADPIECQDYHKHWSSTATPEEAREVLARNEDKFLRFTHEGVDYLALRKHRLCISEIVTWASSPEKHYTTKKYLLDGCEYPEGNRPRILTSFVIREASTVR